MNKQLLVIIIGIVVLIGGGAAFVLTRPDNSQPSTANSTTSSHQTAAGTDTTGQTASSGNTAGYVDYKESAIATTQGTKLLFFHAPWCPQCRALEADIQDKGVPEGVTIFKIDYDTNQALRQKYGVTLQTTLVKIDDQGNLIKKYVAYDEPTLAAVKENLL